MANAFRVDSLAVAMPDLERTVATLSGLFGASQRSEVACAYLFGSRGEEREHRESDVDVAVLLDRSLTRRQRFELQLRLATDIIAALHVNEVDVVVLNEAPPLLARRIVQEGRLVYCRDPETEHAFRRDVQLRAADLEPFIERGRRGLLASVRQ